MALKKEKYNPQEFILETISYFSTIKDEAIFIKPHMFHKLEIFQLDLLKKAVRMGYSLIVTYKKFTSK